MADLNKIYGAFLQSSGISTDSRSCPEEAMFVALKGEYFDGNQYVKDVLQRGAKYAIASDVSLKETENVFIVEDTLITLQKLANHHRKQLGLPIISITGSNGKTTTKELVNAVLSKKFNTKATTGNLNNHIGVPLTLLSFNKNLEIGIVEMGANHIGEIKMLCGIAKPNYSLITNVGKAHLEGFESFEGIKKGKGEMYNYANENKGLIFINKDNPHLIEMAASNKLKYEYGEGGEVFGQCMDSSPFISVQWQQKGSHQTHVVQTNLIGDYNLENILAAITIGIYFGVEPDRINQALEEYQPSNNRSQFIKTKNNQVIMDAYNANPSSMAVALENFSQVEADNKWIVLGGMKEMGSDSEDEHEKLVKLIDKLGFEKVFLIGDEFSEFKNQFNHFINNQEFISYLKQIIPENAYILLKGSRSNKLEDILPYL